jgi:hypothetical protein
MVVALHASTLGMLHRVRHFDLDIPAIIGYVVVLLVFDLVLSEWMIACFFLSKACPILLFTVHGCRVANCRPLVYS